VRKIITTIFCSVAIGAVGQIGGRQAFHFLSIPSHARLAALGGVNVSLADRDINFFQNNPALAGDTLNGFASAGYQFYVADVGNASFSYAHDFKRLGQILTGIQHTSYGMLQGFDESGNQTLEFSSGETCILVGKSHQIGHVRLGATFKALFSNIAGYRGSALVMDLGGIFKHPHKDFTIGLAIKNAGIVLSEFSKSSSSTLPFDVQAGISLKPEYMPLRFSLTGYNLVRSGLLLDGAPATNKPSVLKKVFSHLNAGAEILLHRNVNVLVGYNYLLHQALTTATGATGAGLSFGFSMWVKPIELIVSRNAYTIGNAGYSFTLSTDMDQLLRKKKY
jgi:hypothetical protein